MRYAETHREETHRKLLKVAAAALRDKGPDRIGVADVMKAAGLTHGGFYAHFKSKDALLSETLAEIFAQSERRIGRLLEDLPPKRALATYIDFYVSTRHRDDPSNGCPITALNSDLPRQPRKFRSTFETGVNRLSESLARMIDDAGIADATRIAPAILAAMAGAVALSRTISDRQLSDDLLASTREDIKSRLRLTDLALASEREP